MLSKTSVLDAFYRRWEESVLSAASLSVLRRHRGRLAAEISHRGPGPETHHVGSKCFNSIQTRCVGFFFFTSC